MTLQTDGWGYNNTPTFSSKSTGIIIFGFLIIYWPACSEKLGLNSHFVKHRVSASLSKLKMANKIKSLL